MQSLCDHDLPSLADEFTRLGILAVHAPNVLRTFYQTAGEPDLDYTSISKAAVAWLDEHRPFLCSTIDRRTTSADGTTKLLVRYPDGAAVECVLMPTRRADR